jgi:xanthosine utilization system XapX-like protein
MYTNVNLAAPLGALALLATAVLLFLTTIVLLQSLIVRRPARTKIALLGLLGIAAGYTTAMLMFSFSSRENVLARNQEKHFCELDCHLAYSIVNSTQAKTFADADHQISAGGQFTIITIKTRFDERTTGAGRGNGLLYPNGRSLSLLDEDGNRYAPVAMSGAPLTSPLRPSESYTTDVAFDLPVNAKAASLLINEDAWPTILVIGHENSLLHKKTRFQV